MKRFKRVLLKLSGEALAKQETIDGKEKVVDIFDPEIIGRIADVIKKLVDEGTEVGIVIGAGNIWRGAYGEGVKRARADQMGMLGTMINCLRMEDAIEKKGCPVTVFSPGGMNGTAESYDFRKAIKVMQNGGVAIFGAGLGIPFVTTDTTAVVRAAEIGADVILMAKHIDGIYEKDPVRADGSIDRSVPRFKTVSYDYCLQKGLKATDISASALAKEQKIDMYVFALSDPENILAAVNGEEIGTLVTYDKNAEIEIHPVG
ncbi:MAG: uridine monophosphate kinase [Clostridia bacterium]|nr:uridine monophosphate kinase [Clostridia bacterium]MBQ8512424.1 uridine monophosphate kinase [Clostridia bacterium]